MTDWLQWAAIAALLVFVCFARGSAVTQARRELRAYDERLSGAFRKWTANEVSAPGTGADKEPGGAA